MLLGRVVQSERAELEEQRQKLVADVNANQRTLKGLEDDLLYRLANSEGNLLDDTSLIEVCAAALPPRRRRTNPSPGTPTLTLTLTP